MENVYWAAAFILVCIALYRFGLPALRRFDAENVARIARQEQDKDDPNAHIRHALETAEEQVEPVTEDRPQPLGVGMRIEHRVEPASHGQLAPRPKIEVVPHHELVIGREQASRIRPPHHHGHQGARQATRRQQPR